MNSPATATAEKACMNSMKIIGIKADEINYQTKIAVIVIIKNDNDKIVIISAMKYKTTVSHLAEA